jgi:hypothetical protein
MILEPEASQVAESDSGLGISTWHQCDDLVRRILGTRDELTEARKVLGKIATFILVADDGSDPDAVSLDVITNRLSAHEWKQAEQLIGGQKSDSEDSILLLRYGSSLDGGEQLCFSSTKIYQYFLAQDLIENLVVYSRLGFLPTPRSLYVLNSFTPYFLRRLSLAVPEQSVAHMIESPSSSYIDRMLGFFFIEDAPGTVPLLRRESRSYRQFIKNVGDIFSSVLMRKVARFQLILLSDSFELAFKYVDELRHSDYDNVDDMDAHVGDQSPTSFLLERLTKADLYAALPITVYRLGQQGEDRAVEPLLCLHRRTRSVRLRSLIEESVNEINNRNENSKNGIMNITI